MFPHTLINFCLQVACRHHLNRDHIKENPHAHKPFISNCFGLIDCFELEELVDVVGERKDEGEGDVAKAWET